MAHVPSRSVSPADDAAAKSWYEKFLQDKIDAATTGVGDFF
jgi:hypothetical protein